MTLLEEASRPFGDKRLTSGPSHLGKVSGSSSPGRTPIRAAHGSSASLTPQGFTVCSLHSLRSPNSTAPNKGPASVRRKQGSGPVGSLTPSHTRRPQNPGTTP